MSSVALKRTARGRGLGLTALIVVAIIAAYLAVTAQRGLTGQADLLFWLILAGTILTAVVATARLSLLPLDEDAGPLLGTLQRVVPAATVAFVLLLTWEGLVVGFRVPAGIFPTVASIGKALVDSWPVLM